MTVWGRVAVTGLIFFSLGLAYAFVVISTERRRDFLVMGGLVGSGVLLAACAGIGAVWA